PAGFEPSSARASQTSSEVARASYAAPHAQHKRSTAMDPDVVASGEFPETADGKRPADFDPHVAAIPIAARETASFETLKGGDTDTLALVPLDMTTALMAGDWDNGANRLGDGASDTDSLWSSVSHPMAADTICPEDINAPAHPKPYRQTSSRRSGDRSRILLENDSEPYTTAEADAPTAPLATATHTTNFRLATSTTADSPREVSPTDTSLTEASHTAPSQTAAIAASTSARSAFSPAATATATASPTTDPAAALPNRASQSAERAWSAGNKQDVQRESIPSSERGSNDLSRQQRRLPTRGAMENIGIEGRSSSAFSRNEAASHPSNSATETHHAATRPSLAAAGRPLTTLVRIWVRDNLLTLAGSALGILLFALLTRSLRVIRRSDRAAARLRAAQSATTADYGRFANHATRSRHEASLGEPSRRRELQEQIQADPSGAAAALKQWIGNAA
ncbi:MAG: hypothetical protein ACKO38_10525, partial [Planctomycetota bacterium]